MGDKPEQGRVARALIARLSSLGLVDLAPEHYRLRRTYAGREMRSRGAWSWYLVFAQTEHEAFVGSQWSAAECLRMDNETLKYSID